MTTRRLPDRAPWAERFHNPACPEHEDYTGPTHQCADEHMFSDRDFNRTPSQGFFSTCPVYTFDRLGKPERCDQPVVDMGCRCDDLRWEAPAP